MVYNTGNGASLQNLPDKSQISGKRQSSGLLEIEEQESKTQTTFQELLDYISQSPQYNQSISDRAKTENVYEETTKNQLTSWRDISGNTGTIPK